MFLSSHRRAGAMILALVTTGCVAACGGAASTPAVTAAPTIAVPATSDGAGASAAGSVGPSSAGSCGDAAASSITKALASSQGASVSIIGGCHQASIRTALGDADVSKALDMCDAAAAVGYVDGVSSISVTAASGKELAIGLSSSSCIGEP